MIVGNYYWLGAVWGRWTGSSFDLGNCTAPADSTVYGDGITRDEYLALPDGQYGKVGP